MAGKTALLEQTALWTEKTIRASCDRAGVWALLPMERELDSSQDLLMSSARAVTGPRRTPPENPILRFPEGPGPKISACSVAKLETV